MLQIYIFYVPFAVNVFTCLLMHCVISWPLKLWFRIQQKNTIYRNRIQHFSGGSQTLPLMRKGDTSHTHHLVWRPAIWPQLAVCRGHLYYVTKRGHVEPCHTLSVKFIKLNQKLLPQTWRFNLSQRPSSEKAGTQFFRFLTRVKNRKNWEPASSHEGFW